MKAISSKFKVSLLLLLLISFSVTGQSFSKEGRVNRTFALEAETEIEIVNKYGDITVENWDNDSIKIEITYKVTATKKAKLEPIYDGINFDFKANKYYVVVQTVFEGRGSFWYDVSEIASNLFAAGVTTSIDYTIYIPEKNYLKLNLKYGSIYMANYKGSLDIELSNGNLRANNLQGLTKLDVEFGDVIIKHINNGVVGLRYGTIDLQSADELEFVSASSEIDIEDIAVINIDSKRDKISIGDVDVITGTTYFTKLLVEDVDSKIDLSTKYGSFKLERINSMVKNVQISSYNTALNFYFTQDNNYIIKLISDNKADVAYSAKLGEFDVKEIPGKLKQAICYYGEKEKAIPVNIEIKSGVLTLKVR